HLSAEADPLPGQLVVYDISGHIVRILYGQGGNSFPWDGYDSEENELSGAKKLSEDNFVIPLFAGSEENAF
ncbi:MAG: hypothetical protein KAT09_02160, partial [Candidatus Aegiribacteria sp.]|nr:hypothetical protein [Candidatus Aegiribacteria sp.]